MTNYPVTQASGADVRVRFCPSPTGTPHVGLIRTALFNWAYARHTGGTFVFRIEDTDEARDSEESYEQIIDALNWLGLTWDEGIDVGGPHEPYRQSQRFDIYADVVAKLKETGKVYESFSTADEIEARNFAAGAPQNAGYFCRRCCNRRYNRCRIGLNDGLPRIFQYRLGGAGRLVGLFDDFNGAFFAVAGFDQG
jgi:glutamyl-tRNA synthetase